MEELCSAVFVWENGNRKRERSAMTVFRVITILLAAVGLIGSLAQWSRTPATDPEYTARSDRVKLMVLILAGLVGEAARPRLESNPLLFLWCTVTLAPRAL